MADFQAPSIAGPTGAGKAPTFEAPAGAGILANGPGAGVDAGSSPLAGRPELLVGAAFAGGLLTALILKRLAT